MRAPWRKLAKGLTLLADRRFRKGLVRGVAATMEHQAALSPYGFKTIVDVGANRGQFTLLMAGLCPEASIIAFEPLIEPFEKLFKLTAGLPKVRAVNAAIGVTRSALPMNVSKRDDSSSLLPIGALQERIFPKTGHDRQEEVQVVPFSHHIAAGEIERPSLLKIDVQGYELDVLRSARDSLDGFDVIYVEASFVELYEGQPLAGEVIDELAGPGFRLAGIYNLSSDRDGRAVQADFLFERR